MLNTFDYYEKEILYHIDKYNKALNGGNISGAIWICQNNINPLLNKYKRALWSRNILDESFIQYCGDGSQTSVIYISFHRKVLGNPNFKV